LIEIWPYAVRSRGIGVQQIFGKLGGFFSTYVNPLAMDAIGWKFMAAYTGWLCFETAFIYLFYPETSGRTLEELAFCKLLLSEDFDQRLHLPVVFEGDQAIAKQNEVTERAVHHDEDEKRGSPTEEQREFV
jgi:hypothetical protein